MVFWNFADSMLGDPALLSGDAPPLSYGALSEMADRHAAALRRAAGGRVPLIALDFITSPEAIAAYLGALRAGYPLIVSEAGKADVGTRLQEIWRPDLHLTARPDGGISLHQRPGWTFEDPPVPHPELRVLLSTSGSTGEPKLVRLSARNMDANARSIAEYLAIRPHDRAATTLPLFYSYGLSVLNSYLAAGASLMLTERSVIAPEFLAEARAAEVTSLALVPHQFDLLAGAGFDGSDLPKLRYVTQAGGRLAADRVRHFVDLGRKTGWDLVLMYGQTEAAPRIAYVPPAALPEAADTIGQAIPGGRIWLADESGAEIREINREGELIYEGPNVMMGYAQTREDLAAAIGPARLATGDIAERTAAGYFRITGRMKRFVKLYGLRINLDQVEIMLRQTGIAAHAVASGDRLVLLLPEIAQGAAARAAVGQAYGLPDEAISLGPLGQLPLLPSGKTDQKALERIADRVADAAALRHKTWIAGASLAEILKEATRGPIPRPEDSFTSLGGSSLSYIQLQMVLEERLGSAPPGWENMPLAQLETLCAQSAATAPDRRSKVGIDVVLRLFAITLIVAQHASDYPLFGGTWILIALIGHSMARFQRRQIAQGRSVQLMVKMLYPIVPLYGLLLLLYAASRQAPPPSYYLLLGNYEYWTKGSLLVSYWFVSLYAQIILVIALVAAVPKLRDAAANRTWLFGAGASGVLLAGLLALDHLQNSAGLSYHPQRGLPEALSVFCIGWMIQSMRGASQILATAGLAALTLLLLCLIDMPPQTALLLSAALVLLGSGLAVGLPRALARRLNLLATVTLYVYLLHEVIINMLSRMHLSDPIKIALALPLSFLTALAVRAMIEGQAFAEASALFLGKLRRSSRPGR